MGLSSHLPPPPSSSHQIDGIDSLLPFLREPPLSGTSRPQRWWQWRQSALPSVALSLSTCGPAPFNWLLLILGTITIFISGNSCFRVAKLATDYSKFQNVSFWALFCWCLSEFLGSITVELNYRSTFHSETKSIIL